MTKATNIAAIEKETKKSWDEWLDFFDQIGAKDLSHKEIALKVHESGWAGNWWAQSVTVAYEQHIGRREPGQDNDGSFTVSVTRTFDVDLDETLAAWVKVADKLHEFNGVKLAKPNETSKSDKWRYWRAYLADGSKTVVYISEKPGGKTLLAIQHEKLASADAVETWRSYWKEFLTSV